MAELTQATNGTSNCCAPEAQQTCCEPAAQTECCGADAGAGSCGCSGGQPDASSDDIRETVRERYAAAARAAASGQGSCCSGDVALHDASGEQVFGNALYDTTEAEGVTQLAVEASLGCGVPTAVADLQEGETVLDLGAGAGADVLISARRVGETGKPSAST